MTIIQEIMARNGGFITEHEIDAVVAEDRLKSCLIRCGGGRLSCPAQDVKHWIDIIDREGSDHVRDVSLVLNHNEPWGI